LIETLGELAREGAARGVNKEPNACGTRVSMCGWSNGSPKSCHLGSGGKVSNIESLIESFGSIVSIKILLADLTVDDHRNVLILSCHIFMSKLKSKNNFRARKNEAPKQI
jgi:hypothetical protein